MRPLTRGLTGQIARAAYSILIWGPCSEGRVLVVFCFHERPLAAISQVEILPRSFVVKMFYFSFKINF